MNQLNLADGCPVPPYNAEENEWRARHFDICVAKLRDDAPLMREIALPRKLRAYEYMIVTYKSWNLGLMDDNPDPVTLGGRLRDYCADNKLDGVFFDCPFDAPDPFASAKRHADIINAMSPYEGIINYGDPYTWTGSNATLKAASKALQMGPMVQWVETAVRFKDGVFNEALWWRVRAYAETQLSRGKQVVLEVHDPGRTCEDLAAAVAFSFHHERLAYVYDCDSAPPEGTHVKDYGWNPRFALMRGPGLA